MKFTRLLPLALAGTLAACGGDSSDDLVVLSESARADFAAGRIDSSADASLSCTTPGAACDAEIDALTASAFNAMSPYVDGLDMVQLETAIATAVEYAVQTEGEYSDIDFRYTSPDASQGSSVVINGGVNADSYASGGSTPVINDEQGIYADEGAPLADPSGGNGWYFTNDNPPGKVNWYLYADDGSAEKGYTVADLRSILATVDIRNISTRFFFNVYTLPEGDGNDVAWYRSEFPITSSDLTVGAEGTYTAEFNRDSAPSADLAFTVGEYDDTSCFGDAVCDLDTIADERIFLIAFSTSSSRPDNADELVLQDFTLGFSDATYTLKPAAAAVGSDQNFEEISASPVYVQITSGTDLFNGLVFELTGGGSTYSASLVGGGDITLAQKVLLEKLDRGDGYNALVPEAVFDADAGSLVFDFGTALEQADLANLSASVYSDAGLTTKEFDIEIAADGIATSVVF